MWQHEEAMELPAVPQIRLRNHRVRPWTARGTHSYRKDLIFIFIERSNSSPCPLQTQSPMIWKDWKTSCSARRGQFNPSQQNPLILLIKSIKQKPTFHRGMSTVIHTDKQIHPLAKAKRHKCPVLTGCSHTVSPIPPGSILKPPGNGKGCTCKKKGLSLLQGQSRASHLRCMHAAFVQTRKRNPSKWTQSWMYQAR